MNIKDLLQALVKGQDSLKQSQDALSERQDAMKQVLDGLSAGQDSLKIGQDSLKEEIAVLRQEVRKGFRETNERLDKQGKQLAYLDDDAPTREEHEGLVERVEKLEKSLTSQQLT